MLTCLVHITKLILNWINLSSFHIRLIHKSHYMKINFTNVHNPRTHNLSKWRTFPKGLMKVDPVPHQHHQWWGTPPQGLQLKASDNLKFDSGKILLSKSLQGICISWYGLLALLHGRRHHPWCESLDQLFHMRGYILKQLET